MTRPAATSAREPVEGVIHTMAPHTLAAVVAGQVIAAISDDLVDAVTDRLLERLAGDEHAPRSSSSPLTAREVMARLGRSYDFVRDHRHELGLLEVAGERPRLLFDAAAVERFAVTALDGEVRSRSADPPTDTGVQRRRRPRRLGTSVDLLPIRGRSGGDRAA